MMKPVVRPPGIVGCRMDCMVLARDVSYISNPTHPSAAHSPTGLPYHTTTMKSIVSVKRSKLPPEKKYVHIVSTEFQTFIGPLFINLMLHCLCLSLYSFYAFYPNLHALQVQMSCVLSVTGSIMLKNFLMFQGIALFILFHHLPPVDAHFSSCSLTSFNCSGHSLFFRNHIT